MMDFEQARIKMVDCQVRTCDVTDHGIITAMMNVPREEFVSDEMQSLAYIDEDISLSGLGANTRFLMEPAPFAKLLQLADVKGDDIILSVGCGSGYSAAVLSQLGASVVAIEEDEKLSEFAAQAMPRLGFDNVVVLNAQLNEGYAKEAPFDVIFMDGSVDEIPEVLLNQLAEGGRLVGVEGQGNSAVARIYKKHGEIISSQIAMNLAVKPLPGFAREMEFTL